jgi:probable phosphoglycerate mutase
LIRHGQTDANRDGRIAGRTEAQLTQSGRAAASALAAWHWPKDIVVFVSPQQRALDTAQLAFPEQKPTVLDGLRERDWGLFEGCPIAELPSREDTPEGGEAWEDMLRRVRASIAKAQAEGGLPVLVAHSGVIRAARFLTGGNPHGPSPTNARPYLFQPCGSGWQEVTPDRTWALSHSNQTISISVQTDVPAAWA